MKKIINTYILLLLGMAVMVKAQSTTDSFQVEGVGDDTKTYRVSKNSYYALVEKRKTVEKAIKYADELSDKGDVFYNELMQLKESADPSNPTSVNAYNSKLDQFTVIKDEVTNALKKAIQEIQAFNEELKSVALN